MLTYLFGSEKACRVPATLLFATALVLRFGLIFSQKLEPMTPGGADYRAIATSLAEGHSFTLNGNPEISRAPLFPLFASVFLHFSPKIEPVLLAQAVLDSLTSVWIFLLSLLLMPTAGAFFSGLLYAIHPVYIGYTGYFLSETLFFNLWFMSLAAMMRSLRLSCTRSAMVSGALLGAAVLARPAHIFYPVAAAPIFLAAGPWKRQMFRWILFCFCFAAILMPWIIRNKLISNRFILVSTMAGHSWWMGSLTKYPSYEDSLAARPKADFSSPEADAYFKRLTVENWRRQPARLLAQFPYRLFRFWVTSHSSVVGIERPNSVYLSEGHWGILAIKSLMLALQIGILAVGFWGAWRLRSRWREWLALAMPILYVSLHITNDWGVPRYHLSALPLFWVLGIWALSAQTER